MSERKLNASIAEIPLPTRMRQLPISSTGYPTPWFVATLADGTRDFRVVDHNKIVQAIKRRLCWCCGQPLGKHLAFVIGPMCAVNRVTAEPPAHRDCALYSVRACPFLSKPRMRRNDVDLPEGATQPPGHAIARNPGAMVLWMTDNYRPFRPPGGGVLIELGEPIELQFYREGRKATRDEVMESIDSGMPILRDLAANEGASAIVQLGRRYQETRTLIEAHA
jgi:hypothetical protein